MTITQACGYICSDTRKAIVQQTIDQTGRRQAIQSIIDGLRKNRNHALLQKIRADKKTRQDEKDKILEETMRDIAIRQQYDHDDDFADAVNTNLA